jgi:hypothetical protein
VQVLVVSAVQDSEESAAQVLENGAMRSISDQGRQSGTS